MKVTVTEIFQDKYTGVNYSVDQVIDIDDSSRVDDLVARGLVKKVAETVTERPRKTATRKK